MIRGKYIIPIDLRTLRNNPRTSEDHMIVQGCKEIFFQCNGPLPNFFKDNENCIVTEYEASSMSEGETTWNGVILDRKLLERCKEEGIKNIVFTIESNVIRVDHLPEPEYLYRYLNVCIQCQECESFFLQNELGHDTIMMDDGEEYFSSTICPKCGTWDCVDIEYETIENALIRLKSKKS